MTTFKESDYFEQLQAVEKNYDLLHDFIQSKGLDEEFEKWLKSKQGGRYVEKPQLDEAYWIIDCDGYAICCTWNNYEEDEYRWLHMPLWKTDKDALRYKEIQTFIKSKARPFKLDNVNYYLSISLLNTEDIMIYSKGVLKYPNVDYFDSKKDCKEIIDTIGYDDLKKYYFLIEG